jgi:hypothetical protein
MPEGGTLTTPPRITRDEFMMGLFAALATRGYTEFVGELDPLLHCSVEAAFHKLESIGGYDLLFRIRCHPVHEASAELRDGIQVLKQLAYMTSDSPSGRLRWALDYGMTQTVVVVQSEINQADICQLVQAFIERYEGTTSI